VNITIFVLQKFAPSARAQIFSFFRVDEIECITCGHRWKKGEIPKVEEAPPPEEKLVDTETWLIRDTTYAKVEAEEEVTLEEPLETPVEEAGESSGETGA